MRMIGCLWGQGTLSFSLEYQIQLRSEEAILVPPQETLNDSFLERRLREWKRSLLHTHFPETLLSAIFFLTPSTIAFPQCQTFPQCHAFLVSCSLLSGHLDSALVSNIFNFDEKLTEVDAYLVFKGPVLMSGFETAKTTGENKPEALEKSTENIEESIKHCTSCSYRLLKGRLTMQVPSINSVSWNL